MSSDRPALAYRFYKAFVSPTLHAIAGVTGACRFEPSCSQYAAIAVHVYGWRRGSWLALKRLLRCHPGCAGGFDPVPGTWAPSESAAGITGPPSCRVEQGRLP